MRNYKLIRSIAVLIALFILVISASYAWFISFVSIEGIVAQIGNIDTRVELYYLSDFNKDGLLDIDDNSENISSLITSIYIHNINPGEIYTYRADITNTGTLDGILSLSISDFSGELSDVLYANVVSPLGYDGAYLRNKNDITLCENIYLTVNETISVVFSIKFASVDELINDEISYNDSLGGLNYYQNKTLGISTLTVNLTQAPSESSTDASDISLQSE